jgi:hypothetical protein
MREEGPRNAGIILPVRAVYQILLVFIFPGTVIEVLFYFPGAEETVVAIEK